MYLHKLLGQIYEIEALRGVLDEIKFLEIN